MNAPIFVIRRRGTYGSSFWRKADQGSCWVRDPGLAAHFNTGDEANIALAANTSLRGTEVVPYEPPEPLASQQSGLPASAFIQEWPENKLTVEELRAITPLLLEWQDGQDERDGTFDAAAQKCKAALDRAEEKTR